MPPRPVRNPPNPWLSSDVEWLEPQRARLEIYEERLREALPERAGRVLHRIRETRGGELDDRRFGVRMRGTGPYARAIGDLFDAAARRLGLEGGRGGDEAASTFRRPAHGQLQLL